MSDQVKELRARVERCLDGVVAADVVDTVLFCFDRSCRLSSEEGRGAGIQIAIDRLVKHRNECGGVDVSSEIIALHEHLFEDDPVLVVYPDQDTAKAHSQDRIQPLDSAAHPAGSGN